MVYIYSQMDTKRKAQQFQGFGRRATGKWTCVCHGHKRICAAAVDIVLPSVPVKDSGSEPAYAEIHMLVGVNLRHGLIDLLCYATVARAALPSHFRYETGWTPEYDIRTSASSRKELSTFICISDFSMMVLQKPQ
ncbi:hypothetical protein NDU88_001050 [Pleurodeles waltl]|uniref:Uncharacterized protein n=1 Tax=Pleurodeles waltl TaxID=8319 RepID=A0AAV7WLH4_PLEWA|nr:hypothetical protein NDU88_001050 [Pleurodeles waltl]